MNKRIESVVLICAIFFGILLLASPILSLYTFANIERKEIEEDTYQARRIVYEEIQQLYTTAGDYAGWDDSYAFMQDENPKFISSSLGEAFYSRLRLNLYCMFSLDGRMVFGTAYDHRTKTHLPVPPSLARHFGPDSPLLKHKSTESSIQGFLSLPEGLLMIVSRPILTSEYAGPIRGILIIGRYFDDQEAGKINAILGYNLNVFRSDSTVSTTVFRENPALLTQQNDDVVQVKKNRRITSFAKLTDIYGGVAGLVSLDKDRNIYFQAKNTTWSTIVLFSSLSLIAAAVYRMLRKRLLAAYQQEHETKERLETFFQLAVDGILRSDAAGGILQANRKVCEMTGYSHAAIMSMNTSQLFLNQHTDGENLDQLLRTGEQGGSEGILVAKDGRHIHVETTFKRMPDGTCQSFIRDISERKQLEESLQAKRALLYGIIDGSADIIYSTDLDGNCTLVNKAGEQFTGRTRQQMTGSRVEQFNPKGEIFARNVPLESPGRESSSEFEETLLDSAGNEHVFLSFQGPLFDKNQKLYGYFAIKHDITRLRQLNNDLVEHRNRISTMAIEVSLAEERERNRIAGELHDQVGPFLMMSKLKVEQLQATMPETTDVSVFESVKELLTGAIQEIRSLTFQLRPPILAKSDLETALRWLAHDFVTNHGLQVEVKSNGPPLSMEYGIKSVLFQAVRELLLNTVKHAAALHVDIVITNHADQLEILVADDGTGFPDPYEKVEYASGFGLFNIQEKIRYLNGTLRIDSAPGCGARIVIAMPHPVTEMQ